MTLPRFLLSGLVLILQLEMGIASEITSFHLVDAAKDEDIKAMVEGETIVVPEFSIRAEGTGEIKSVEFRLEGVMERIHVENAAPYALGGDSSGNFHPLDLRTGKYRLTATPYAEAGSKGKMGKSLTLSFSVKSKGKPAAEKKPKNPGVQDAVLKFPVGELKEEKLTNPKLSGSLKQYEPLTLTFEGPKVTEDAQPNPFRDYRLEVQFVNEKAGIQIIVPGHFAADGNAAESSTKEGNLWRAYFVPEIPGPWRYWAWFRKGENAAIADVNIGVNDFGEPAGEFEIEAAEGHGFLRKAPDSRYLRFSGSQEYYLKGGADSPETFLAYADFDDTWDTDRDDKGRAEFIHHYEPHVKDWKEGDPTWKDGKGKGMIGALNYLASEGMNSVYFLTYNLDGGDGRDVWPWTAPDVRDRFDVSKLDQWNLVFDHMDELGLALHIILQEQENDQGLNDGALGDVRRLYFRELISRFGHHPALIWNLGEENTNNTAQQKAFCDYIRSVDAYEHPIVVHTFPNKIDEVYTPLLGYKGLDGPSLQMGGNFGDTHAVTLNWIQLSKDAGHTWFVCHDETGPAGRGADPDDMEGGNNHAEMRSQVLWGNLMAGGGGVEWYFGYKSPHNDLNCEDWRSRDQLWDYTRYALEFFQKHVPYWEMESVDSLLPDRAKHDHLLAKPGEIYVVYLDKGRAAKLDLTGAQGEFQVQWYNPREGGKLVAGSKVTGGGVVELGAAPDDKDWVVLLKK